MDRLTPVEQRAPGKWQIGTVAAIKRETPRVKSFLIELPMWMPHLPGQHYDVRLTAPDGYRTGKVGTPMTSASRDLVGALTLEQGLDSVAIRIEAVLQPSELSRARVA